MERIYTLSKYQGLKSRHTCPACGHKHEFARYVDAEGIELGDDVGRCNRESRCGYHRKPADHFRESPTASIQPPRQAQPEQASPVAYVPEEVMRASLKAYESNSFVLYLETLFNPETVGRLIEMYHVGTTKNGGCIFWQVDPAGAVRTGKVIRYNGDGHRDKSHPPYFVHTRLGIGNTEQCLFGLHLGGDRIGLVEAEKTCIVMAGRLPAYTWMATGGKTNLSKVHALRGKKVVAFPDGDAFAEWSERLAPYGFRVSDALQKYLTPEEQVDGKDLADFVRTAAPYFEELKDGRLMLMHPAGYPLTWCDAAGLEKLVAKNPAVREMIEKFEAEPQT